MTKNDISTQTQTGSSKVSFCVTMAAAGTLYQQCSMEHGGNANGILECLAIEMENDRSSQLETMNSWLIVICGSLVFFMQAGFAMLCAGCVRKKNVQNTMLKNLLDACGAALAFFCVGYAFAFGGQNDTTDKTFLGNKGFFLHNDDVDLGFFFFQYAFSAASVTIVAGTLAERCQMAAYLWYSVFLSGFVYPVVVHAVWSNNGILSAFAAEPYGGVGAVDFAGSGVVHLTGGVTALIATAFLGPRRGRFHDNRGKPLEFPKEIVGHSQALQILGTMILWFGWYGFNCGSALLLTVENTGIVGARAAANTSLAAASGAVMALVTSYLWDLRMNGEASFNLGMAMNGALSGLVAVTAACGTVEVYASCIIGSIAAWAYMSSRAFLVWMRLDDAVDAIPVHLANGVWGLIATGLFTSPMGMRDAFGTDEHVGLFYQIGKLDFDMTLLLNQLLVVLFIVGWCCATMIPFFFWLSSMKWLRADVLEELVGLDTSYHGGDPHAAEDVTQEEIKDALNQSVVKKKTYSQRNASEDRSKVTIVTNDVNSMLTSEIEVDVSVSNSPPLAEIKEDADL